MRVFFSMPNRRRLLLHSTAGPSGRRPRATFATISIGTAKRKATDVRPSRAAVSPAAMVPGGLPRRGGPDREEPLIRMGGQVTLPACLVAAAVAAVLLAAGCNQLTGVGD